MNERAFEELRRELRRLTGIDLASYKSEQMRRRFGAFVSRHAAGDVRTFCQRLASDAAFRDQVKAFLTINVSEFYRDPAQFAYLETQLLPELLSAHRQLRIWSAGCSHGAEAYTIAMLLLERSAGARATIVASDIDAAALGRAAAGGPYTAADVRNLPAGLRGRYLEARSGALWVTPGVRSLVQFRDHDLLRDRFERGWHLIVCRNVLIYLAPEAKRRVLSALSASLAPGGVLFLGGTEAVLAYEGLGLERRAGNFYSRAAQDEGALSSGGRG